MGLGYASLQVVALFLFTFLEGSVGSAAHKLSSSSRGFSELMHLAKQGMMTWGPATYVGDRHGVLVPGLGLAQTWLLGF